MRRWYGIRHVRWFIAAWRLNRHLGRMRSVGLGVFASQSDIAYLDAIREGRA